MHRIFRNLFITTLALSSPIYVQVAFSEPIPSQESKATQTAVTVVFIHSRECPICAKVSPIVEELRKQYEGQVKFVDLDVTDRKDLVNSKKLATSLKLGSFFALYKDSFPCVGIFNSNAKCVKELFGANPKKSYVVNIETVLRSQ
jgi:thiol-disulfide isomerase/thioredoxin